MSWHYVDPHNFFPTEKEHYPYQKPYETSILPIGKIDWSPNYHKIPATPQVKMKDEKIPMKAYLVQLHHKLTAQNKSANG